MTQPGTQYALFESVEATPVEATGAADGATRHFSDYVVYVDESGDHSLSSVDRDYPVFVLALCVFHKRHYSERIIPAVEKLKFNYFGHDSVVLHENEIRKQKGPFAFLAQRAVRDKFMGQLTSIMEASNFILIACVVECRGKREDAELELEFRRIRDGGHPGGRPLPFDMVFADKKTNLAGLQLADLVARPVGINYLRPAQENKAFELLRAKFYCAGGRHQVGRDFEEVGLMVHPPQKAKSPDEPTEAVAPTRKPQST